MFNYFPDNLADTLPRLTQPFLIMHGAQDKAIPLSDAQRAIEAAGSSDKELIVLDGVNGGAEHCNVDDPDPDRPAGDRRLVRRAPVSPADTWTVRPLGSRAL